MIAKHVISLGGALFFGLLVFFTMQLMIASDGLFEKPDRNQTYLDFVRVDPNTQETQTKDRRIPDPPPPPEQPQSAPDAEANFESNTSSSSLAMDMPTISTSISQGDGPSLGTLGGGGGLSGFDTDVVALRKVDPKYPTKALQAGIQGYVTMDVIIDATGSVTKVTVVESEPGRLFDRAAIQAMKRYKFQPKMVDGRPQPQKAKQTIKFEL